MTLVVLEEIVSLDREVAKNFFGDVCGRIKW